MVRRPPGQQRFGGDWTEQKLEVVQKYLGAYTTALKNQPFKKLYIDAFAGSGESGNLAELNPESAVSTVLCRREPARQGDGTENCAAHSEGSRVMAQGSDIEWTESTWNPVTGCTKVSPGSGAVPTRSGRAGCSKGVLGTACRLSRGPAAQCRGQVRRARRGRRRGRRTRRWFRGRDAGEPSRTRQGREAARRRRGVHAQASGNRRRHRSCRPGR